MLHVSSEGGNAVPFADESQPTISGFSTTGLPDEVPGDLHDFMREVLGDEPILTPDEVEEMYRDYLARRQRDALRAAGELPEIPALTIPVRMIDRSLFPAP